MQRVSRASVDIGERRVAAIGPGLFVLLGISREDNNGAAERLAEKVRALRHLRRGRRRMNEPLGDREILCVQPVHAVRRHAQGQPPDFVAAAPGGAGTQPLYERFCERAGAARGEFGAHMSVGLVNDGPVTVLVET